ncbi:MAG: hypothetical protein R3200_04255 [Xanthomonadales bacterium]|nr:hypothetical protein [Xanthomonadales bacterium]
MARSWQKFPYPAGAFDYSGESLADAWDRLHRGDREPFPSAEYLDEMNDQYGVVSDDPGAVSEALQEAWRCYHRGDFADAVDQGLALGPVGYFVANKAQGIYAANLEEDETAQLKLFQEVAERAEEAQGAMPKHANSFYFQAFALGRYSQGISITKALSQGLGGKIKTALERALELEPDHADAHTAMGLYHAEIIDKVGKMVGKLTYGASADKALGHFKKSTSLFPESPIVQMEYANGLLLLKGDDGYEEASELYVAASEAEPMDAMEKLDVEAAKAELE